MGQVKLVCGLLVLCLGGILIASTGPAALKNDETVGERFRKAIEKIRGEETGTFSISKQPEALCMR